MLEKESYCNSLKCMRLQSLGCFLSLFFMHAGEVGWREKNCQAYSMLWQKEVNVGVVQEIILSPVWKVLKRGAWQEGEHAGIEGTTHMDRQISVWVWCCWLFPFWHGLHPFHAKLDLEPFLGWLFYHLQQDIHFLCGYKKLCFGKMNHDSCSKCCTPENWMIFSGFYFEKFFDDYLNSPS